MDALLHSPFLQALGYAIINSLWQFAFLWLLYFSVNSIFKLSSHQKYTTGLVLELAGFTWFLVTLFFYYNQSLLLVQNTVIDQPVTLPGLLTTTAGTSLKQQFFLLVLRSEQFFPYLSIAYLALLIILTVRWMYAYRYSQQVRISDLEEIAPEWQLFVQNLASQLGVKRRVEIFLSALVQTPLTVGFFKPVILIPLATLNYLNTQQMEAVILHEMAHIRRYDYLFNLLLALIEACLFFNPFMQLIHQQVKKERENCCDDWVIKFDYCAASYARALLQIASNQNHSPLLALKATENKKLLINRIQRIIEKKERTFFNHKYQLLALLVLTTVFCTLSLFSPAKRITKTRSNQPATIVFEPMAAKVKNPLFNPVFFLANSGKTTIEQPKKIEEVKLAKVAAADAHLPGDAIAEKPSAPPAVVVPDIEEKNNQDLEQRASNYFSREMRGVTIANEFNTSLESNAKLAETQDAQSRIEKSFLAQSAKQGEIAEKQLKRFQRETDKEREVVFNLESIRPQLRTAIEQIKSAKTGVDLIKLQHLVRMGMRKMEKEKPMASTSAIELMKMEELELLEKHIELQIDSINTRKVFASDADLTFNFQLPAVVYTFSPKDKEHNFSFQYSGKVPVRVIGTPTSPSDCANYAKRRKVRTIITANDDETKQAEIIVPAPAPAKYRAVYVIKI